MPSDLNSMFQPSPAARAQKHPHKGISSPPGNIHPTALIDPMASIADDVQIGPYCIVEGQVSLARGNILAPYVHIKGCTHIGEANQFYQGCIIGEAPQSKSFNNPEPRLIIGKNNVFREYMTIHCSSIPGTATVIGDDNFLMAYCHIAHDCLVGNSITFSNSAGLSGHVTVEDNAFIAGLTGVHQFAKIGSLAMIGGVSKVAKDVPPYVMTEGNPAYVVGLNKTGMRRRGFSDLELRAVKNAYKILYRSNLLVDAALLCIEEQLLPSLEDPQAKARIAHFLHFCQGTKLGIMAAG